LDGAAVVGVEIGAASLVVHVLDGRFRLEGVDISCLGETRLAAIDAAGAERALGHIVLAGPDDLYGGLDGFRNDSGLVRVIEKGLAAETAAEEGHIDDDVFHGDAHAPAEIGLYPVGTLYRSPDLDGVFPDVGDTIERLHAGMRLVGGFVDGLDLYVRVLESLIEIACAAVVETGLVKIVAHAVV